MLQNPNRANAWQRPTALAAALWMLLPVLALPAQAQLFHRASPTPGAPKKGMSTGKKVALVAGAALLYYLYRRHVASQQAAQASQPATGTAPTATTAANNSAHPQLYRSRNGGIYYRDAQGKPVWLTVPSQPVAVSTADLQKYAPDYQQYQGKPAPAAPAGYRTQSFSSFDPTAATPASGSPGPGH